MTKPRQRQPGVGKEGTMPSIPNTIPTELNDAAAKIPKKSRNLPETKLGPKAVGERKPVPKEKLSVH